LACAAGSLSAAACLSAAFLVVAGAAAGDVAVLLVGGDDYDLVSFPTRRSSDLAVGAEFGGGAVGDGLAGGVVEGGCGGACGAGGVERAPVRTPGAGEEGVASAACRDGCDPCGRVWAGAYGRPRLAA